MHFNYHLFFYHRLLGAATLRQYRVKKGVDCKSNTYAF